MEQLVSEKLRDVSLGSIFDDQHIVIVFLDKLKSDVFGETYQGELVWGRGRILIFFTDDIVAQG